MRFILKSLLWEWSIHFIYNMACFLLEVVKVIWRQPERYAVALVIKHCNNYGSNTRSYLFVFASHFGVLLFLSSIFCYSFSSLVFVFFTLMCIAFLVYVSVSVSRSVFLSYFLTVPLLYRSADNHYSKVGKSFHHRLEQNRQNIMMCPERRMSCHLTGRWGEMTKVVSSMSIIRHELHSGKGQQCKYTHTHTYTPHTNTHTQTHMHYIYIYIYIYSSTCIVQPPLNSNQSGLIP